jgi:OCT family organic cation transporter-like MFS transporter 4/5
MTILDLFKTPKLRKYTLIFWYSWIVNALVYYGFSFNMSDFGGNFYITFLLSGLVELPSALITALGLKYIGRRNLFSFFMLLITLSTLAVIPSKTTAFKVTFALLGKFAVSSTWNVMGIHGPEVFPTVIRHTGLGSCSVIGRIGSISAPYMKNLVRIQIFHSLFKFFFLYFS